MKWLKLILSIIVGAAVFFVVFNKLNPFDFMEYSGWMSDVNTPDIGEALAKAPSVPFFKQLLFFLYMVVVMFVSTGIAVAITEKYKLVAAIIVGVISGVLVLLFVTYMLINIGHIFTASPITGGIIGWVAFKYSGGVIQKIKARSKALISEFDD